MSSDSVFGVAINILEAINNKENDSKELLDIFGSDWLHILDFLKLHGFVKLERNKQALLLTKYIRN